MIFLPHLCVNQSNIYRTTGSFLTDWWRKGTAAGITTARPSLLPSLRVFVGLGYWIIEYNSV
jgi:hypothetical protein